jgi:hypothetical protein
LPRGFALLLHQLARWTRLRFAHLLTLRLVLFTLRLENLLHLLLLIRIEIQQDFELVDVHRRTAGWRSIRKGNTTDE